MTVLLERCENGRMALAPRAHERRARERREKLGPLVKTCTRCFHRFEQPRKQGRPHVKCWDCRRR